MKKSHRNDDHNDHLLFREGSELIFALCFVVAPVYLDVDAPHVVLGTVALLHVLQVAAGIDRSKSRSVLLWTSVLFDFAAIVTVIYRNWTNFTDTNDAPIRTTHALYTVCGLVALGFLNLFRWVSMQSETDTDDHDGHVVYITPPPTRNTRGTADKRNMVAAALGAR